MLSGMSLLAARGLVREETLQSHGGERGKDTVGAGVIVHGRVVLLHGSAQHARCPARLLVCGANVAGAGTGREEEMRQRGK